MKEKSIKYKEWETNRRVWEADRKIILYPESWLDPGMREDKSPYFEELENELLSGEITGESAEKAASNYFKKITVSFHGNLDDYLFGDVPTEYNWELFFYVPFYIACILSAHQRYEEARDWYHKIYDPAESQPKNKSLYIWKFQPFIEILDDLKYEFDIIIETLDSMQYHGSDPHQLLIRDKNIDQAKDWKANPNKSSKNANLYLFAYQRAVIMMYIDNLIAWGDHQFRMNNAESNKKSAQLYMTAMDLLKRDLLGKYFLHDNKFITNYQDLLVYRLTNIRRMINSHGFR